MQYTDEQRISKIIATVDKLIAYVKDSTEDIPKMECLFLWAKGTGFLVHCCQP